MGGSENEMGAIPSQLFASQKPPNEVVEEMGSENSA